jgi:hypothetical protein
MVRTVSGPSTAIAFSKPAVTRNVDRSPISGITIPRQSVVGSEGLFCKMFDPPTDSPPTPEQLNLVAFGIDPASPAYPKTNPVPSVMEAAGLASPATPFTVRRRLCVTINLPTWEPVPLKNLIFYTLQDSDLLAGFGSGQYPAATLRVPRGAIFQAEVQGTPMPPHTIHWHGIEPTAMNDGVGHCSMEVGSYLYQWQPNFIGTYFYHCHRNTVQHFEFGLFGLMLFHPPDAFFASIAAVTDPVQGTVTLNAIPVGACRDGLFRTAANLLPLPAGIRGQFNFKAGDPIQGVNTPDPLGQFPFDPHAFTVAYDVEALWVPDDRDSVWSDLAQAVTATFPTHGLNPGVDDVFNGNPGTNGFFNFNDHNADYWFITGVPVPAPRGGSAAIPAGIRVDPHLNSGVGMVGTVVDPTKQSQVSIQARVGQTVFVRCLDAAYNSIRVTFPVDIVIIEWDGRALGVPPLNRYNRPYVVTAGTPIMISTARRFGAIFKATVPMNGFATVEFLDTKSTNALGVVGGGDLLMTAMIPIEITA